VLVSFRVQIVVIFSMFRFFFISRRNINLKGLSSELIALLKGEGPIFSSVPAPSHTRFGI
jgi:hypothetical protein